MTVALLAREVELLDIRTTGTLARLGRGLVVEPGANIELSVDLRAGFTRLPERAFDVVFAIDCRPRRTKVEREFGRFIYRGLARYQAKSDWPDEVLDGFTRTNAMMHLWPYARQFVHLASTQLGLPPVILPPFRVQARAEEVPQR